MFYNSIGIDATKTVKTVTVPNDALLFTSSRWRFSPKSRRQSSRPAAAGLCRARRRPVRTVARASRPRLRPVLPDTFPSTRVTIYRQAAFRYGHSMVDIRELARLSGVSPATVSRALNDRAEVSPETRRRIQQ